MTKEQLRNYARLKLELSQIDRRLSDMRADVGISSPSFEGMPSGSGPKQSATEATALALVELSELYQKRHAELVAATVEVERAIASLEDPVERVLMRSRYIDGLKWEEVCLVVGYSWQQTHRIHARALGRLEGVGDNE